jgi:hypothetical protein
MDNKPKRILKSSNPSVFVGGGGASNTFRLDVRDDGKRSRSVFARQKLFHYISAGGMKQLRRTSADDLAQLRMQSFLVCLALGAAVWLFFYLLPIR